MTQSIEIFSLEAIVLGAFGMIVMATEILNHFDTMLPKEGRLRGILVWLTMRLDRFLEAFHRNAPTIPWMLAALLISVIAPVYDMYVDVGWVDEVLRTGTGGPALSWPVLLQNSHERTLATMMHVAQSAIVLATLWIFSFLWNFIIEISGRVEDHGANRAARWSFIGAFNFFIVAPTVWLLAYLGEHAEILYHSPHAAM